MKILKIAAKDLPLFNGICEIDFLPQQRVNSENAENMSELFSTPSNTFYKNNVISFTGINASGKTSVLKLITFVFGMLNNTPINSITCSEVLDGIADNNTVSFDTFFFSETQNNKSVYLLNTVIAKENNKLKIVSETLKSKDISKIKAKKALYDFSDIETNFTRDVNSEFLLDDVSIMVAFNKRNKESINYTDMLRYTNINELDISEDCPVELISFFDPLEVIDKYGADALRFFLATGNTPGNDMRYSDKRVEACANFANKLWNASRYVHMNIDDHDVKNELPKTLTTEDKWIVSTLNTVAKEVNENLEKFELGIAVQKIYEFIWDCYCDWYIELVKTRLSSDGEDAQNARQVLLYVLDQILRLLHPFMPYITEEIWQTIPHEGETVMLAKYPEYNAELDYPEAADEMEKIMSAIRAIRNRRAEMNVPPSRKAKVYVATKFADTFRDGTQFIQKLASASEVEVAESFEIEGAVNIVTSDAKIYIPMDELVDREKELARLNKELEQVKKRLAQSEGKLNNQGFVAKAPEAVIEKVKGQAAKEREQIALIEAAIAALK